jgi:hypothetical protein
VQRITAKQQLESVLVGWIVRSSHHHPAMQPETVNREADQRGRPERQPGHGHPAGDQPIHQRHLELGRAQPPIARHREATQSAQSRQSGKAQAQ